MSERTIEELKQLQSLPLWLKVRLTKDRIRQWINAYGEEGVYVSFSGGKDSTVLLHLVREDFPGVVGVFIDTGLEYPEVRQHVKTFDNIEWIKPEMNFKKVIQTYGYPIVSKDISQAIYDARTQAKLNGQSIYETKMYQRTFVEDSEYCKKYPMYCRSRYSYLFDSPFPISYKCCDVIKKHPAKSYEKKTGRKPILATMACESRLRRTIWMKDGCNAFDSKRPKSKPMSFWTENDVLEYIYKNNIKIASVYGNVVKDKEVQGQLDLDDYMGWDIGEQTYLTTGLKRTGCMFCMFGCMSKEWNNFSQMKKTHPNQYAYIMKPQSQGGLGFKEVIEWINEHGNMEIKY